MNRALRARISAPARHGARARRQVAVAPRGALRRHRRGDVLGARAFCARRTSKPPCGSSTALGARVELQRRRLRGPGWHASRAGVPRPHVPERSARLRQLRHHRPARHGSARRLAGDRDARRRRLALAAADATDHRAALDDGRSVRDQLRAGRCRSRSTAPPGLSPLSYASPVASAQVKTALLLAGLRARGGVMVTEPALSRDHTERLLPAFGVELKVDPDRCAVSLCGPQVPRAAAVRVPRDPSSAAFLVAAALLVPGSEVVLPGVSLNPTRIAFLSVLQRMGADIEHRIPSRLRASSPSEPSPFATRPGCARRA